ncbi:Transposase, type 1 [Cinara cedri]|uniref:Transposase, type 1 n=1 Tax=Cinara cedri TaxID=506608 RepID=A0A5E4N5X2_9HEMI|nr:Transposase, type 1 [Cinara cedri]
MLIAFFVSKGLIHCEFVSNGQTVNAKFYLEVMKRLMPRIHRIRPEYRLPGSWTLLQDNAPANTATLLTRFYAENKIIVLSHSPYSPDLAPADYFLFPKLKLKIKGHFFDDIPAVQRACTKHKGNFVK